MKLKATPKMHPMKERAELLTFVKSQAWMTGFCGLEARYIYEETVRKYPALKNQVPCGSTQFARRLDMHSLLRRMPHLRGLICEGYREGRAHARVERQRRASIEASGKGWVAFR